MPIPLHQKSHYTYRKGKTSNLQQASIKITQPIAQKEKKRKICNAKADNQPNSKHILHEKLFDNFEEIQKQNPCHIETYVNSRVLSSLRMASLAQFALEG